MEICNITVCKNIYGLMSKGRMLPSGCCSNTLGRIYKFLYQKMSSPYRGYLNLLLKVLRIIIILNWRVFQCAWPFLVYGLDQATYEICSSSICSGVPWHNLRPSFYLTNTVVHKPGPLNLFCKSRLQQCFLTVSSLSTKYSLDSRKHAGCLIHNSHFQMLHYSHNNVCFQSKVGEATTAY